jgi:hypothetical protein
VFQAVLVEFPLGSGHSGLGGHTCGTIGCPSSRTHAADLYPSTGKQQSNRPLSPRHRRLTKGTLTSP